MRTGWIAVYWAALLAALLLAACGSGDSTGSKGDPNAGKQLFNGEIALTDRAALPCKKCHSVEPGDKTSLWPNLSNIGNRAGTTVPGQTATDYLLTAITDPNAYLADGFQDGIMYRGYGRAFTAKQMNDLVAYMLTLKSGRDE